MNQTPTQKQTCGPGGKDCFIMRIFRRGQRLDQAPPSFKFSLIIKKIQLGDYFSLLGKYSLSGLPILQ